MTTKLEASAGRRFAKEIFSWLLFWEDSSAADAVASELRAIV